MRTVFMLFDSLNRLSLEPYGATKVPTPNFNRLAKRSITFDKHYVGSMPCIPARRDLQSGRLNFLHRSWGPMEPFDNSFPEILGANGVYSHLVTDHLQYFRDGGATYHTRYNSYDFLRGQHGDAWKGDVAPDWAQLRQKYHTLQFSEERGSDCYHHIINRQYIVEDQDYPLVKCLDSGLEFIEQNRAADDWFLQIETFDPHEPFNAPERFRDGIETDYDGPILDWPPYGRVTETPEECAKMDANYRANLKFCDEQLGRLLDYFEEHDLWENTALVVSTDHGYLLGEHDWWAKNQMPIYEEIAHIPLFIHHPATAHCAGERRNSLTQTMDLMPTFLTFHSAPIPTEVVAHSLVQVLQNDTPVRDTAIFGTYSSALNITDGRYMFMLYPENVTTDELFQYTVMPTTLNYLFRTEELAQAEMVEPFDFTKGSRLMRIPTMELSPFNKHFGPSVFFDTETVLFDLQTDPEQKNGYRSGDVEDRMKAWARELMQELDAPREMYGRFGLRAPTNAGPRLRPCFG